MSLKEGGLYLDKELKGTVHSKIKPFDMFEDVKIYKGFTIRESCPYNVMESCNNNRVKNRVKCHCLMEILKYCHDKAKFDSATYKSF